jgi:hypothetical protein
VALVHQRALIGNATWAQHHERSASVCAELNRDVSDRLATVDLAR